MTRSPAPLAHVSTGVGVRTLLRPAGRGGAVTTARISNRGSAATARNDGTANPPLPNRIRRLLVTMPSQYVAAPRNDGRFRGAIWLFIVVLIDGDQLIHRVEIVDVEGASEMI